MSTDRAGHWLGRTNCNLCIPSFQWAVARPCQSVLEIARTNSKGGAGSSRDCHFLGDLDFFAQLQFPNRLQERNGESKIEDIHDRFLSEEVINTEDRFFREHGPRKTIKFACRGQVSSKRLLNDDAGMFGQAGRRKPLYDRREKRRRNGEVVCGMPSTT